MALRTARDALSRFFYQRCFWLFVMLLALIAVAPFLPATMHGRIACNWINAFVLIATVAAVGRTLLSFVIVLLLAVPTIAFQWLGLVDGDEALVAQFVDFRNRALPGDDDVSCFATCSGRK